MFNHPPLSLVKKGTLCIVMLWTIPSKIDEKRLYTLRNKYRIPDKVNPRLVAPGEWCYTPNSLSVGIYEAYLLRGLRLPLNAFAKELLHRLGIGPNQLNPNGWRTIVAMQILWRWLSTRTNLLLWTSSYIVISPLR